MHKSSRCFALVPAAGVGMRAGQGLPKQYARLNGQALLSHTLARLHQVSLLQGIMVVLAPDDTHFEAHCAGVQAWVARVGGESRAQSVLNGLHALQAHGVSAQDWVLVHDAARCLIQPQSVTTLIETCRQDAVGGILALPVSDTLKNSQEESAEPRIQSTLDRRQKWLAQTPQMFRLGPLEQALAQAQPRQFKGITDEASAMEQMGHHPLLVEGRWDNLKLTYPQDFEFAQHWLNT